jgi:lipopolysaccharide/colanic/teichoic acid biosynthesis glycosyltransferase
MLKFRSTRYVRVTSQRAHAPHQGAELAGAGTHARRPAHALRASRFDKLLRTSGLERLPRLFNVLRGEMSLVGPRPLLLHESEQFDVHLRHRMSVLPGITGLWQVTARNRMPFDEMARIDLSYIETMNLWLDLRIMLRTPWALLGGK